jgi:hypothetical protein
VANFFTGDRFSDGPLGREEQVAVIREMLMSKENLVGRPITDIKTNLRITDLTKVVTRVIDSLETLENQVEVNN